MRVGFLGLGRLGLPIAAVLSQHHTVYGVDPAPGVDVRLVDGHEWEHDLSEYLGQITHLDKLPAVDVVVVCVQTPHDPVLDGTHPDTGRREPFDLTFVEAALASVGHDGPPVVVMSTVMPGDCRRLAPLVSELIYAPAFPAMGTTIRDFLNPEFVLMGFEDGLHVFPSVMSDLLFPVLGENQPYLSVSWETAELTKLAYNTAIGLKLALTNNTAWLADMVGADGGEVMEILSQADRRITSPAYLKPGLGDGGACHPRDQLAMSWLAQQHGVYDLYGNLIAQREAHTEWIIEVASREQNLTAEFRPVVILGSAYKADSTLRDGSPALLMANLSGWPITDNPEFTEPAVVVIGVPHSEWKHLDLPEGSTLIDPWGHVSSNVPVVRPGRHSTTR